MTEAPHAAAFERLAHCRVIPVVVLPDAKLAEPLAHALLAGGIDVIEITLRNDAGLHGLERVARLVPDILTVAGTVITAAHMREVASAGAQAVVSPGFSEEVDAAAKVANMPWLPGVATASDCMRALAAGRSFCKFFPAEQAGGPAMIKALAGPFPSLSFCPTGGVSEANLGQYLALPMVRAVGGSWIAPTELIAKGGWDEITARARRARALAGAA